MRMVKPTRAASARLFIEFSRLLVASGRYLPAFKLSPGHHPGSIGTGCNPTQYRWYGRSASARADTDTGEIRNDRGETHCRAMGRSAKVHPIRLQTTRPARPYIGRDR